MSNDPRSLSTELSRVRYLGSARSGTSESWYMRLTSAALVPLSFAFVIMVLSALHRDYNGARHYLGEPLHAMALLLFVLVGHLTTPSSGCVR